MRVSSVSRSILGMPTFRESCSSLYQGKVQEEQPDTELFLRVVPLLYITLVGVVEEKKRIVSESGGMAEIGQSLLTGRIVFHILLML